MKAYWHNLSQRDRMALSLGLIFCAFYTFYVLIYAPLQSAIRDKLQQLHTKQEDLTFLQDARLLYKSHRAAQVLTSSQLLTVIAHKLNEFKQYPYELQQGHDNAIQLSFTKVPYNAFIVWLYSLNEKYKIGINQLSIEHTDTQGLVRLELIISTK